MQSQDVPEITPEMLQQNPVLMGVILLVAFVILAGGMVALASWGWVIFRVASGSAVLPLITPWRPRLWSLVDLVVMVGMLIGLQVVIVLATLRWSGIERGDSISLEALAANGLSQLLAVLLACFWIQFRYRQGSSHVGLGSLEWKVLLPALAVGLASLPIIYLMMIAVSALSQVEYEHPLINSAAESGTLTGYLMGCFAAVIAAPIAEEFFFRVMIQGWLQSIPFKSLSDTMLGTTSYAEVQPASEQGLLSPSPLSSSDVPRRTPGEVVISENPYNPPSTYLDSHPFLRSLISEGSVESELQTGPSVIPPIWPSVVAGILFGAAHIGLGMSFIPLSVMGVVLGLIYRQTHSVWPCIFIHASLNFVSMLMLGLMILLKQAGT